jgi:polyhydroxybutyrate depolymerase
LKAGDSYHTLTVGTAARTYLLHLPSSYGRRGETPMPVLIVLHGSGTNGSWLAQQSELNDAADKRRFAVAYPDGSGTLGVEFLDWPTGDTTADGRATVLRNVHFMDELIRSLARVPGLDRTRVFVAGVSNGGIMTYTIACELADKISGFAIIAGEMPDSTCGSSRPLPALIIHGTADDVIPYDNHGERVPGAPVSYLSAPEAVAFWARHDGCPQPPKRSKSGNVIQVEYLDCTNGTAVVFYTLVGGEHEWPGGRRSWLFGHLPTRELYASPTMLDFFSHHAVPAGQGIVDDDTEGGGHAPRR